MSDVIDAGTAAAVAAGANVPPPAVDPPAAPNPPVAPPAVEAADWRATALGELPADATDDVRKEHEAMTKVAAKYTSMKELIKGLRNANVKISSGSLKTALPKDANEAQIKEWREENGIPASPDKYDLKLDPGTVLSDEDKGLLQPILAAMHNVNAPPEAVSAGVKAYFDMREEEIVAQVAENERVAKESKIALTEEWGARDFDGNMGGIKAMLEAAGKDVTEAFMGASGLDGVKILAKASVVRWLAQHARETGYVGATLTYGTDGGASVAAELQAIEKRMADDPTGYYKDDAMQKRYTDLVTAKDRHEKK